MRGALSVIFMVAQPLVLLADDGSARRYMCLPASTVTCKYYLLAASEVQNHLGLTEDQIKSFKSVMLGDFESLPGYSEFRRLRTEKLETASSDEERSDIRTNEGERLNALFESACLSVIQTNLSPNQAARLEALLIQMRGPSAILEDRNLSRRLDLSEAQVKRLSDIKDEYSRTLSPLCHRYLGLQINPARQDRSNADLNSEMKKIVAVIKEVQRDQDSELLRVLTKLQREHWNTLCGARLSISWKDEWFTDVPFAGRDSEESGK